MKVEILSIGDELILGALVDTNCAYIADQCILAGLEMGRHTTVGDTQSIITETLLEISKRTDVAIVTGGLGPTLDDLTRNAAADAAQVPLIFDEKAFQEIKDHFAQISHQMPKTNRRQAYLPEGGEILPNPIGTAPGFSLKIGGAYFFFCPGVPREMKKMLQEQVFPRIGKLSGRPLHKLESATLFTFGLTEAVLGEYLEAREGEYPGEEDEEHLQRAKKRAHDELGSKIFVSESQTMSAAVIDLLKGSSLSVLEIDHGGMLADWLTEVPLNAPFLGVLNSKMVESFFSPAQNHELVEKLVRQTGSDYGLVMHGITSEEEAKMSGIELGRVSVAIYGKEKTWSYSYQFKLGSQEFKKRFFAMFALDLLRRTLLGAEPMKELLGVKVEHKWR